MSKPPSGPDQSFSDDFALPVMPPVDGATENGAIHEPAANGSKAQDHTPVPAQAIAGPQSQANPIAWWEPALVLVSTFLFLAILAPRIITFLSPLTGDER